MRSRINSQQSTTYQPTINQLLTNQQPGKFDIKYLHLRKKWRSVQAVTNTYWLRFIKEYLSTLTSRFWRYEVRKCKVSAEAKPLCRNVKAYLQQLLQSTVQYIHYQGRYFLSWVEESSLRLTAS